MIARLAGATRMSIPRDVRCGDGRCPVAGSDVSSFQPHHGQSEAADDASPFGVDVEIAVTSGLNPALIQEHDKENNTKDKR